MRRRSITVQAMRAEHFSGGVRDVVAQQVKRSASCLLVPLPVVRWQYGLPANAGQSAPSRALRAEHRCLVQVRTGCAPSRALRPAVAAAQADGTKSMKPRSTLAVTRRTRNC